ncbi:hypothetical protein [Streptomyces purpureus]|uniref:Uncharacterized protein n=1 Tax=Streptomyces purpureus TaxID=1951 RepID=A0A918LMA8_9ACTN|nr:hypothetical protein [Streptomyces purpureus]GGT24497.1 hypothetical protein GCM10014713_17020 [Streptomyces purpureus]
MTMNVNVTLGELTARTGLDVLDHLEREVTVPVVDGMQAQGDLIVVPLAMLGQLRVDDDGWWGVPPEGVELLRSSAGGNPHTLVADRGRCRWTTRVDDPTGLAIGALEAASVAYLIHPEHGASGIAPGRYVVRRQQERALGARPGPLRGLMFRGAGNRFVCD